MNNVTRISSKEHKIIIDVMYDSDLKPDQFTDDEEYQKGGSRYNAWLKDEFYFCGVRIRIELHNWTTGNHVTLKSAGVWGFESDYKDDAFREAATDELANLLAEHKDLLKDLPLDVQAAEIKYS